MRGMFTAGVIDVLIENGIEFNGALGVSAGAAFGGNYKSKQIGQVIRYHGVNDNTSFLHLRKRCSLCGILFALGLGAISNMVLKKTSLV